MKKMKWVCLLGLASGVVLAAAVGASGHRPQQDDSQPWQVGRCYRVFPADRDQAYTFKVLGPVAGDWLRVQSDPAAARVPGARAAVPLWLNLQSPFAIQEWPCVE